MKYQLPKILLYSRLMFALVIVFYTITGSFGNNSVVISLLYIGIITDIFDGIIARKLEISTDSFRVQDTVIDLLFYLAVLGYIAASNFQIIIDNKILIIIVLSLETFMYLISITRFKKLPSPHALLSKLWGIYIVVEFTLLLLKVEGSHFQIALCFGILVHLDRVLIYSILKKWDHDIPSSYHAFLVRKGKVIKRNKIFNG
ncbi:MAG: CDP-alcohol phosphatidyltransferase family protein [Saprospiraceae bacterium]|nr:CDP-alcohol phosphatidyltransferase family protein [Saprospiraceae bacterium]